MFPTERYIQHANMLTCFWDHGIKAPRRLEQGNTWFACDAFYTSSCLVWITVKVLKCAKDLNRSGGCLQVLCFVTIPEDFCVLNGKFRDAKAKGMPSSTLHRVSSSVRYSRASRMTQHASAKPQWRLRFAVRWGMETVGCSKPA